MKIKNNNITITHPEIAQEWHPTLNGEDKPEYHTYGENKKYWWICKQEHEYYSDINHRMIYNIGCPYCANKKVLKGYNDVLTTHPNLIEDWDILLNPDILLDNFTQGSNQKVWWKCHVCYGVWLTRIADRTNQGNGCPYCSGRNPLVGKTDLLTINPKLCEEWNYTKNKLGPENYTRGSSKKVWWICKRGHEWQTTISNRISSFSNSNCPYCSGHKVIVGKTDLLTLYPELCKEWDGLKNKLGPKHYRPGSKKRVWWLCKKCKCNWQSTIQHRALHTSGCPQCRNSKGENLIATYLDNYNIRYKTQKTFNDLRGLQSNYLLRFDFYVSDYNLCIEYNGYQHYYPSNLYTKNKIKQLIQLRKTKQYDRIKKHYCRDNNINLLIIHYKDFDNIDKIIKLELQRLGDNKI
jgi:hypothetical protein